MVFFLSAECTAFSQVNLGTEVALEILGVGLVLAGFHWCIECSLYPVLWLLAVGKLPQAVQKAFQVSEMWPEAHGEESGCET